MQMKLHSQKHWKVEEKYRGGKMIFRKKDKLRSEFDQLLISQIKEIKAELTRQKDIVDKSVEPSEEILQELKALEAKYFFLLRQAKIRNVSISKN